MIHSELRKALQSALDQIFPDDQAALAQIKTCPNPKFGDYQSTSVMAVAKRMKTNPREIAEKVVSQLKVEAWCSSVEIAGPGFLNFRLKDEALQTGLERYLSSDSSFISVADEKKTVVVDFSSPNVAKSMHVGHIRSTVLGDCIARLLRARGHRVITDNHIGDWGTQFGMLLYGWKRFLDRPALESDAITELERLYKKVNRLCSEDEKVLQECRSELVALQDGDDVNLQIWNEMIDWSRTHFDTMYERLDTCFDHTLGESFYNPGLSRVVDELKQSNVARESEGAAVVFFDEQKELKDHPAIVQKSDGAANYATTDLATLEYRLNEWAPDEIVYVTDGRQQLHFKQVFEIFKRWKPNADLRLNHVWFGAILGKDGKPFKTRSGETVKLKALLDEAEERCLVLVKEKNPDLSEDEQKEIARVIGIGAVKYADLSPNRQSDYVFDWDKLISFTGNTAPYIQYAYTRTQSIFREARALGIEVDKTSAKINLKESAERALGVHLLNFDLVIDSVVEEYRPNYLCAYLFELASLFAKFYEACPVLRSEGELRLRRLTLCAVTAKALKEGLSLLGITTTDRM